MCDPVTLAIAAASTLGSSYLQNKAANDVSSKRSQVINNTNADLDKYRANAQGSFDNSLQAASPAALAQGAADATAQRTAAYTQNIKQDDLLPTQNNASDAAKRAIVSALATGEDNAKETAARRAIVDAYGDSTFNRNIALNRNSQNINTQGNFATGREGVSQLQLADANHAGDADANLAGIVAALGTVAGAAYGGLKAPSFYNTGQGIGNTAGNVVRSAQGYYGPGF